MAVSPESEPRNRQMADAINAQASSWMKRGIALLNENTPSSLKQALQCFDRGLELRHHLPLKGNPDFSYGLAACWMNRADALTRLGGHENLLDALNGYGQAVALLHRLPMDENPKYRRRLATAWLNRGFTLEAQQTPRSLAEAVNSFVKSIEVLREVTEPADEDRRLLGCALMNHANTLFQSVGPTSAPQARASANEALQLLASLEERDVLAAEAALKARHVLCRALAHLLNDAVASGTGHEELVSEATDVVDEGMENARHWEQRGVKGFRPLVCELFNFGSRVYQAHQPHFLPDFVLESLDPARAPGAMPDSREMHAMAMVALRRALGEIQRNSFSVINTPRYERALKILEELRVTEARLEELRLRHLSA